MQIEYFFSVLSDWAYLGGERLDRLARRQGARILYRPMRMPEVFERTGGILLSQRSRQRQDYRVTELRRWSGNLGMPLVIHPRYYPTDDRLSSCMIIATQAAGLDAGCLANAILRAIWAEERDISDARTLRLIADGLGLDGSGLLQAAEGAACVDQLAKNTDDAVESGVFGSPFYLFEGELYWGQDRLPFLEAALAAKQGGQGRRRLIAVEDAAG